MRLGQAWVCEQLKQVTNSSARQVCAMVDMQILLTVHLSACVCHCPCPFPVPADSAVDCGDPGTPTNGQRSLSSTTYNAIVTYTCDVDYTLQGSNKKSKCLTACIVQQLHCLAMYCAQNGLPLFTAVSLYDIMSLKAIMCYFTQPKPCSLVH